MVRSMFAAVAGLRAHQTKMDVIGNNIANVNTYGYKKARATFKDQFYATINGSSAPGELYGGGNPSQIGYGSQIGSIDVAHTSGGIAATDIPTDCMIAGNGYFMVGAYNKDGYATSSNSATGNNPKGLELTRVGIFYFDGAGNLVDGNRNHVYGFTNYGGVGEDAVYGKPGASDTDPRVPTLEALKIPSVLVDENGKEIVDEDGKAVIASYDENGVLNNDPNTFDPPLTDLTGCSTAPMKLSSISIGADGTVSGISSSGAEKQPVIIGKIAIANVPNPNALEATSNSNYKPRENTGIITAEVAGEGSTGSILSGKLEMANVDISQEFTDMITTQRGFQANTRIITVTDEMLQELVNIKR